MIDPPSVTIWTADRRDHQLIQRALGSVREGVRLTTRTVPAAGTVVCYDPPSPQQLAQLSAMGEVVLLVPPGELRAGHVPGQPEEPDAILGRSAVGAAQVLVELRAFRWVLQVQVRG